MEPGKRILVAVDLFEESVKPLRAACLFAETFEANLSFIYVGQSLTSYFDDYSGLYTMSAFSYQEVEDEIKENLEDRLQTFLKKHLDTGCPYESLVRTGDTSQEIIGCAEQRQAGMIVIGTHGRQGVEGALLGSVARKVVAHAPCPVLTVRI